MKINAMMIAAGLYAILSMAILVGGDEKFLDEKTELTDKESLDNADAYIMDKMTDAGIESEKVGTAEKIEIRKDVAVTYFTLDGAPVRLFSNKAKFCADTKIC